jgi:Zn-dependent M28 family amino/carboxypeptidase
MNPHVASPGALEERLRAHVTHLAGTIGPRHMDAPNAWHRSVTYVHDQLQRAGGPVQREAYPVGQQRAENLLLDWPGADPSAPMLIVGAHYDTVTASPGADDNASAVAALIEIARALAGRSMRRPLRLIAFANEEKPHEARGTMGSQHHAQQCRAAGLDVEMIALEMLGYFDAQARQGYPCPLRWMRGWALPKRADFIAMVSNLRSAGMLCGVARAFAKASTIDDHDGPDNTPPVPTLACPLPQHRLIRRSDHGPFWDQGYRAMMITDTSFLRNPHYHQPTDTADTLDYTALAGVTAGLASAIAALVG